MEHPPTLADILLGHRVERGWTQAQVADTLGVRRQLYDQWESGARPQGRHAVVLANYLGLTPVEVLAAARRVQSAQRIAELEREVEALRRRIREFEDKAPPTSEPSESLDESAASEWLSVQAVASLLGLDPSTVYKMIARDGLPVVRSNRIIRIRRSELEAWTERQRARPGEVAHLQPRAEGPL